MKLYRETQHYSFLSAVLGAFAMAAWLIPLLGLAVSLGAIGMGIFGVDGDSDGYGIAGLVLGIIGLILTVLRSGLVYVYG